MNDAGPAGPGGPPAAGPDLIARELAAQSIAAGSPTDWFERLYAAAAGGHAVVPWDAGGPEPMLVGWARQHDLDGAGRRALVTGCGPGYDAEFVAGLGYRTTAFDVSPTAVRAARDRFPGSPVEYLTADLLHPPPRWQQAFDLVIDIFTVQSMPPAVRAEATARVRWLTRGTLLVIGSARDDGEPPGDGPPWRLSRPEVEAFAGAGLEPVRIDRLPRPGGRSRWRAEFRRAVRPAATDGPGLA